MRLGLVSHRERNEHVLFHNFKYLLALHGAEIPAEDDVYVTPLEADQTGIPLLSPEVLERSMNVLLTLLTLGVAHAEVIVRQLTRWTLC